MQERTKYNFPYLSLSSSHSDEKKRQEKKHLHTLQLEIENMKLNLNIKIFTYSCIFHTYIYIYLISLPSTSIVLSFDHWIDFQCQKTDYIVSRRHFQFKIYIQVMCSSCKAKNKAQPFPALKAGTGTEHLNSNFWIRCSRSNFSCIKKSIRSINHTAGFQDRDFRLMLTHK